MRLLASTEDVVAPATRKRVAALLKAYYPTGEAAALLTEGIMELGETVCIPNGEAACLLCPLGGVCRACAAGTVQDYPVRSKPRERRVEQRTVLLLRCGERFALRRRPDSGLLAGLWEFPNWEGECGPAEIGGLLGTALLRCTPCGSAKHVFSHVEWHMQGWLAECAEELPGYRWLDRQTIREQYSIPTAFQAYRKTLMDLE